MERFGADKIVDEVHSALNDVRVELDGLHEALDKDSASEWDDDLGTTHDQSFVKEFTVGPGCELSVSNVSGRIDIHAVDGNIIRVRAVKHGSRRVINATHIEFTQSGNRVSIHTGTESGSLIGLTRRNAHVDFDIEVPHTCAIQAKGVSANLDLQGIQSAVRAETVSGDMRLTNVTGDCQVTTVSGDLEAFELTGTFTMRTTSGDARIRSSQCHHFNVTSVSGDFHIESPLTQGRHYLAKTVSGDVYLRVPSSTAATIQLKTVSGRIGSDLPAEIIKSGRRYWQGRINGGGANVEMSSVSGNLRLSPIDESSSAPEPPGTTTEFPSEPDLSGVQHPVPADPSATIPPTPADSSTTVPHVGASAPSSRTADTSAILSALERGDIDVEEAMARMDALG